MKIKYLNGLLAAVAVLACSCSDWLDVTPRTEMKEETIYQREKSFQNVMNGIYIQLAEKQLYGMYMSCYFPDVLAGYWYPNDNSTEAYIKAYDFTESSVENVISSIWSHYYTAVAHINNLLENLDRTDVKFSFGNKELLLGEAYGLRAFIHLELLRLFGPVPEGAADGEVAIPYVKELTLDPSKLISVSYGEVKKYILEDLAEAEKYLKNDPYTLGCFFDFNNPGHTSVDYTPEDTWHYYRQTHFNCYAVDATRARFYQWIGDGDNAALYAKKVVDALNPDGTHKFELATEANSYTGSSANLVMQCEHIFAVNSSNHQSILRGVMWQENSSARLRAQKKYITSIYSDEDTDIRCRQGRYFQEDVNNAYYLKYVGNATIDAMNVVPLLRLSEMYLILIENTPAGEAADYFETYRISRQMSGDVDFTSPAAVRERVEQEYRREFWAEGQLFFYYKRNNKTKITVPQKITVPAGGFVIPKPKGQILFEPSDDVEL